MTEPALAETRDDIDYVTSQFAPLAAVSRPGGSPFGVAIPAATYRTPDGTAWFARDVWRLADDAGSPDGVRALFARRYGAACETLRMTGDLDEAWQGYLAGDYGACLRDVTPETIAAKERLVSRLTAALAAPRAGDPAWRARVRADVEALDGLEKRFASCDRVRFGPTTRDRLIDAPRAAFSEVFAGDIHAREQPARHDLAVRLPHRPGALAELGEALGRAGCNIEGGGGFALGDHCLVHFLVGDAARAARAARDAGFEVATHDVLTQRLDQSRPGQLGAIARALAESGVNIETVYSDHDHQLILGVDDLPTARRVAAAWAKRTA